MCKDDGKITKNLDPNALSTGKSSLLQTSTKRWYLLKEKLLIMYTVRGTKLNNQNEHFYNTFVTPSPR